MAKVIRFNATYYDSGEPKYVGGKHYPITEDTLHLVGTGVAQVVEVDLTLERAQELAEKAAATAAAASTAAEQAKLLADAARAAQEELDQVNTIIAAAAAEEAKARASEQPATAAAS